MNEMADAIKNLIKKAKEANGELFEWAPEEVEDYPEPMKAHKELHEAILQIEAVIAD